MVENKRAELARVQKELAERISEAQAIEALFWRLRETQQTEQEKAVVREFARERFKTLLEEIETLRRREYALQRRIRGESS